MPILFNPELSYPKRSTLYAINDDGEFVSVYGGPKLSSTEPISETSQLRVATDAAIPMLSVHQTTVARFPSEYYAPIDMAVMATSEPFFKTSNPTKEENCFSTFTSLRSLIETPELRTKLFKDLIRYIPEEQLALFCSASVKSLIK